MTRLTFWLLAGFVFTVPWDVVQFSGGSALSRLVGLATMGAAALTVVARGRFRKINLIVALAAAFTGWAALSLVWTISYPDTLQRVITYVQLLGSVWVVNEIAKNHEDQQWLLVAFILGEFVPLFLLLKNFNSGVQTYALRDRYTATGFNADDIGLTLVIGIPIAWHLIQSFRGPVRVVAATFFALAPLAILLTGTRGAFLAGVIAISIVPLTLPRQSPRALLLIGVLLAVIAGATSVLVPPRTWGRILSIKSEVLGGGSMTGRADIWKAGITVFPEYAVLGAGAGAYGPAVGPVNGNFRTAPHNMPLGVLVEQGVIGFVLFAALLTACAVVIVRMPSADRKLWAVLMLCWMVGVMSLNWEYRKVTWLLFGLMAAKSVPNRLARMVRSATEARRLAVAPQNRHTSGPSIARI